MNRATAGNEKIGADDLMGIGSTGSNANELETSARTGVLSQSTLS